MFTRRSAKISISITIVILSLLATQLTKLGFDYEFEKFFPIGDPDLVFYEKFKKTFGADDDYIMVGIESENGLFNTAFLTKLDSAISGLKTINGTKSVTSPTNLKKPIKTPLGYIQIPYLHSLGNKVIKSDSVKLLKEPIIRDSYFSDDMKTIKIIVTHFQFPSKKFSDKYVSSIDSTLSHYDFKTVRKVGKAIAQHAFIDAIKADFTRFLIGVIILITILMTIFIRSTKLVIVALSISLLSVMATMSIMVMTGKKIDILSSLIPSILLVVSMSDIIHLFSHIRKELSHTANYKVAIGIAVKEIGWATFLTSITTAIGFITLINIRVIPIIDLGKYAAAGIFTAFIITYLLFPAVILLTKPKFPMRKNHLAIIKSLTWTIRIVFKKRGIVFLTSIGAFVLIIFGISKIEINDYLIDDIPDANEVKTNFQYFDNHFGGSKPFTLSIQLTDSSQKIYSKEVISEINKLENIVDTVLNAGLLVSPASYIKGAHQSIKGGNPDHFQIPSTNQDWKASFNFIKRFDPESKARKLSEGSQTQIIGYSKDLGSKNSKARKAIFNKITKKNIDLNIITFKEIGTTYLVEKSSELLSLSLLKGLLLALAIVGIIAGIMFKSFKMILITLIPNLFPILAVAAVMGFFGIPINLGTSIIFAISFGIVVDDTIHFLSKFKIEKEKGLSTVYALKRTIYGAGEPIIITTIILTAGFVIFCISEFSASFYTGLFVSVSFIVALIADLFLLPALILQFMSKPKNESADSSVELRENTSLSNS
ncbi:efflux RND transporter permease subunit [Reichenbachiella versicolor]|uniref:efflux RND transporter permease subunit n=1 Tax=Reichenbachiella versicolor TaxID=1821036 RepID=UPI000D6E51C7|nr:MMPL family transporter [Reichenbachiella versicolor]